MPNKGLWIGLKQWVKQERRVLITSSVVAGGAIVLRLIGILQSLEWATLDQMFRFFPLKSSDHRVVIVRIDEEDLQQLQRWPISDAVMAELVQKINSYQPRAIGLDIYRDLPIQPGSLELAKVFTSIPNLIGIERIKDNTSLGVAPSPTLSKLDRVGFNNLMVDADGKVRRNLLYWLDGEKYKKSFALKLALSYLKVEGVKSQAAAANPQYLQLGKVVFRPFEENDGAYVRADAGGYQILANFPRISDFESRSMTEVLKGKVPPEFFRDRVVLIGSTASSLGDLFYTPHGSSLLSPAEPVFGVEVKANFISQIITAALEGKGLINVWSEPAEAAWIWLWAWIGASICWRWRSPQQSAVAILVAGSSLSGICLLAFVNGWWLPLVPSLMTLTGSSVAIIAFLANLREELNRSKEFLQKVIETIADPIFVKDREHRWIILNQAYCKFIDYPLPALLNRTDRDIFSSQEANIFWQQDELVFQTGQEQENEEYFTNATGKTYAIATKRSLHKDAAGNLFLVGVIRDITERKRMEEDLKQLTADLIRSNQELKVSETRLRHQAHHDSLTGLPNRTQFQEHLNQSIEWGRNHHQLVALLFLDLDGFKQVNDTKGHGLGDKLLKAVAERLTRSLRGSDTVSRLGGDEFTVILPAIPKVEIAARVAEKILATLCQEFLIDDCPIVITVSIGISIYPLHGENGETLLKQADIAMYRAKELGRNRYEFSESLALKNEKSIT